MSLKQFVEETDAPDRSLVLVNWDAPRPLRRMLEDLFDEQSVEIQERRSDEDVANELYLLEDGDVIATSPLSAVQEAILLVNSDTYITGDGGLDDLDVPDVVGALTDARFLLRGYPESNKEKLLLITISRFIERLSLTCEGGWHRASFQRLSRIHDEQGTHAVYERLAASDVDTHVYGVPDWTPSPKVDLTMHGGWSEDFRDSWFVLHVPEDENDRHAALVAVETEPRLWDGFWTYESAHVRAINDYVERTL